MQRLVSWILVASLILPIGIACAWYNMALQEQQHMVAEILSNPHKVKTIRTLSLSKNEQKSMLWKKKREFEYLGQMYDLIDSKTEGDTTNYTCFEDKKEGQLRRSFTKLWSPSKNDKEGKVAFIDILKISCFSFAHKPKISVHFNNIDMPKNDYYKTANPIISDIFEPPEA